MNNQIKELVDQAGLYNEVSPEEVPEFTECFEKFAELMVKECGLVLESYDPDFDWATKVLKKHFGVEK